MKISYLIIKFVSFQVPKESKLGKATIKDIF